MTSSQWARRWALRTLFIAGIGLVGAGAYVHATIGGRTLGHCVESGACDPWHPTWVVTPVVLGTAFVAVAGYLRYRRERGDRA